MSTPQGPELHLDVSTLQRPMLHLDVSSLQGPSCTWTYLYYSTMACAAPVSVSRLHEHMMHLDVSTPQGPELHLDAPGAGTAP